MTVQNTSSTTLEITWKPPPATNINGELRSYLVVWFETQRIDPEIFNKTIKLTSNRRKRRSIGSSIPSNSPKTLQIDGLKKFTMYTIRISAFTIDNGVFFEINATTAEDGKILYIAKPYYI